MAKTQIHSGIIVDDTLSYTLKEVCEICGVHADYILEMIEYGILEPKGKKNQAWKFSAVQVQRSKQALRLQHDLELNLAGAALALELLERVTDLQSQLDQLEHQLKLLGISTK